MGIHPLLHRWKRLAKGATVNIRARTVIAWVSIGYPVRLPYSSTSIESAHFLRPTDRLMWSLPIVLLQSICILNPSSCTLTWCLGLAVSAGASPGGGSCSGRVVGPRGRERGQQGPAHALPCWHPRGLCDSRRRLFSVWPHRPESATAVLGILSAAYPEWCLVFYQAALFPRGRRCSPQRPSSILSSPVLGRYGGCSARSISGRWCCRDHRHCEGRRRGWCCLCLLRARGLGGIHSGGKTWATAAEPASRKRVSPDEGSLALPVRFIPRRGLSHRQQTGSCRR